MHARAIGRHHAQQSSPVFVAQLETESQQIEARTEKQRAAVVAQRGDLVRHQRQMWLVLLGSFLLYILTFAPTHPYNQAQPLYFLRNWVLMCCSATLTGKLLCFLPVAGALLLFAVVPLRERAFGLLYPTTVLFFLPMWLIEQRYTLIPFTLFLALREQRARAAEASMVLVYVVTALVFMSGILARRFFL